MDVSGLYPFVLLLVLVGFLIGVGVLALDKFQTADGITADAVASINASKNAIGDVATTWLPLIVVIAVLAIIIGLVMKGFAGRR